MRVEFVEGFEELEELEEVTTGIRYHCMLLVRQWKHK
jgi:hypothetical protein